VDISNGADMLRIVHIDFSHFRAIRPRMLPEFKRDRERVDLNPFPPLDFVAMIVELAMMRTADRNREFVANLATQSSRLGEAQMVSVRWRTSAH
jgi:hypothetical protein